MASQKKLIMIKIDPHKTTPMPTRDLLSMYRQILCRQSKNFNYFDTNDNRIIYTYLNFILAPFTVFNKYSDVYTY